jgi:hypothetical protein
MVDDHGDRDLLVAIPLSPFFTLGATIPVFHELEQVAVPVSSLTDSLSRP